MCNPLSFKRFAAALLATSGALLLAAGGTADVAAGKNVVLTYGNTGGPHATVTFNKSSAAPNALMIETFLAGVAGSKLTVRVDRDPVPLFVHTFLADECRFEQNASRCSLTLSGHTAAYGRLLDGFRRGRVARVQIETGGVMAMNHPASLDGFKRATRRVGG